MFTYKTLDFSLLHFLNNSQDYRDLNQSKVFFKSDLGTKMIKISTRPACHGYGTKPRTNTLHSGFKSPALKISHQDAGTF